MNGDEHRQKIEAIEQGKSYLLASYDNEFLQRPELRPVRLQLELLKPELFLNEQKISSTIVVFGGTQIVRAAFRGRASRRRENRVGEIPQGSRTGPRRLPSGANPGKKPTTMMPPASSPASVPPPASSTATATTS